MSGDRAFVGASRRPQGFGMAGLEKARNGLS